MKTFFNITIEGIGKPQVFRIQSTKLRKFDQSARYGFYRLQKILKVEDYHVSIVLALTYSVELGGVVSRTFKQRRYQVHQVHYELYTLDKNGMYVNQYPTLCSVSVTLDEQDVMPCNCTISVGNR